MNCKRFNDDGLKEFIAYIDKSYEDGARGVFPQNILTEDRYSENVPENKDIDHLKQFRNRYEIAVLFEPTVGT